MTFESDAKPCPFCGNEKMYLEITMIDEEPLHYLVCNQCGCEGPYSLLLDTARMLWNIRQPQAGTQSP